MVDVPVGWSGLVGAAQGGAPDDNVALLKSLGLKKDSLAFRLLSTPLDAAVVKVPIHERWLLISAFDEWTRLELAPPAYGLVGNVPESITEFQRQFGCLALDMGWMLDDAESRQVADWLGAASWIPFFNCGLNP